MLSPKNDCFQYKTLVQLFKRVRLLSINMKEQIPTKRPLRQLDTLAKLMDSQFRVPGTEIRFGLDAIVGLIPGVGDMSTFAISSYMLWIMAQNGVSNFVMARMVLNVLIDTLIGSIPLIGDLFDVVFKSNTRNMKLMHQHYREGRHNGSAWKVILPVVLLLFFFIAGIVWLVYQLLAWLYGAMF